MFSHNEDGQQAFALGLVFTIAALAVALVLGVGISKGSKMRAAASSAAAGAPAPAGALAPAAPVVAASAPQEAASAPVPAIAPEAAPAVPPLTQSGVTVESETVRFYFASGSASLAAGADAALAPVVAQAKEGRTVVISGFHDASGSLQANADLARKRAAAVRDALARAGVPAGRIVLQKPVQMEAGNDAEARRVDITVQ